MNALSSPISQDPNGAKPGMPASVLGISEGIYLRQIFLTVWRHKWLVIATVAAITSLSYIYIGSLAPRYTAEVTLLLDTRNANVGIDPVVSDRRIDANVIRSEVDVLRSRWVAHRVAATLGLANDPEFNPRLRPHEPGPLERLSAIVPEPLRARIADSGDDEGLEPAGSESDDGGAISETINMLLSRVSVVNDGRSYTVVLYVQSEDPARAAEIADAFAREYLAGQQENKFAAAERAASWLEKKIGELRERVRRNENAVLNYRNEHSFPYVYRNEHSLPDVGGGMFLDSRLFDLTHTLAEAREVRVRAEMRLNETRSAIAAAERETLRPGTSGVPGELERLIGAARGARAELAQLRATFGQNHPLVVSGKAEVAEIESQIRQEGDRIIAGLESDLRLAAAMEREFVKQLEQQEAESLKAHRDELKMQELTSEAEASRSLLESFMANLDRTSIQLDLVQPDARVLSWAETPTWPSFPQRDILLALSVLVSLMMSLAIVFTMEFLHKGFRAAEQIERSLGLQVVGMVPRLRSRGTGREHPSMYALAHPFSTFTESVRLVRSATRLSDVDAAPKVVLITSALPHEGKTALALTLGRLGASARQRVLLIDCDLRTPSVATELGSAEQRGLTELLSGDASISEVVQIDEISGLRFIPAGRGSADAIELLNSGRMERVVAAARAVSHTVILDSPPVTVVSDPLALSRVADMTLLVVRWDRTPRSLVAEAVKKLAQAHAPPTGVVLSQVDLSRHASYGVGDYPHGYLKGYLSHS